VSDRLTVGRRTEGVLGRQAPIFEPVLRHDQGAAERCAGDRRGGHEAGARQFGRPYGDRFSLRTNGSHSGKALLVFAEGSRSRTGGMQRLLPGVARRYLSNRRTCGFVPMGLTGTDRLFPIGEDRRCTQFRSCSASAGRFRQNRASARNGEEIGKQIMDGIGARPSATLLPSAYRGGLLVTFVIFSDFRFISDWHDDEP